MERGYKVITLSHLPGHALDISDEYDNLYYPFGQHILSGAKLIAHHPNLYAVYLTNHGCGPDTMLSHLFKQEMGDKPYLQIEVDEHFSNVGVITRIEAFLNSLQHRPAVALPTDFNIEQVDIHPCRLAQTPSPNVPLYLPAMGAYTPYLAAYFKQQGADPYELPHLTDDILSLGRAETSAKEYLPFPALLGSILAERKNDQTHAQFLIPQTQGAEADGQYARVIRAVLDRRKELNAQLVSPMLETLPEMAQNRDALFRTLLAGDILYAAPADKRADISAQWDALPGWEQLHAAAREIGALPTTKGRRIAANMMFVQKARALMPAYFVSSQNKRRSASEMHTSCSGRWMGLPWPYSMASRPGHTSAEHRSPAQPPAASLLSISSTNTSV